MSSSPDSSDKPGVAAKPGSSDELDSSAKPGSAGNAEGAENLGDAESSGNAEQSGTSEETGISEESGDAVHPDNALGNPEKPSNTEKSGNTEKPSGAEKPSNAEKSGISGGVGTGGVETVVVRPRKVRRVAIPTAVALVIVFAIVGILLRSSPTGALFRVSDQVAMAGLGVLLAAGVLLTLRPRLRADTTGVEVRNVFNTHRYDWSFVRTVSFPDGAPWARLELPEDEYVPIVAIQAYDGSLAVRSMRQLRELRRKAGE